MQKCMGGTLSIAIREKRSFYLTFYYTTMFHQYKRYGYCDIAFFRKIMIRYTGVAELYTNKCLHLYFRNI